MTGIDDERAKTLIMKARAPLVRSREADDAAGAVRPRATLTQRKRTEI